MISAKDYQKRRSILATQLPDDAVAIVPAAMEVKRNGDSDYPFRQNSDFFYLTGFEEPDAVLVIKKEQAAVASYLFNRPRNPAEEQWTGARLGQEEAPEKLCIEKAFPIETLESELPQLLKNTDAIYYRIGQTYDKVIFDTILQLKQQNRRAIRAPQALVDLDSILSELRVFKGQEELDCIRQATRISVDAHIRAMRACKHLNNEGQLEAELLYELRRQGLKSTAYPSIVGSGANTCILHYQANDKKLEDGDLVLIDAGGEFNNYAADITRTFPVNGRFSPEQRAIYELVLAAQQAGIAAVKPGTPWSMIQQNIVRVLTEGLIALKILKGNLDTLIELEAYKPFYMHSSGHWLGLDVHDCGAYKINNDWRSLEPNMVLTVEPGLYLQAGIPGLEEKWWNIGVRIEDDILVTPTGYENLTKALPVLANDIEALMGD